METREPHLFETPMQTASRGDSDIPKGTESSDILPVLGDDDHHMIDIVAAYIQRVKDNKTRKYIARLMINIIIKSADL